MSKIHELLIINNADNNYLSLVRNGFILLIVAASILSLNEKFSRYAPIVFALVILLLLMATYHYWRSSSTNLTPITYIVIVGVIFSAILLYESISL